MVARLTIAVWFLAGCAVELVAPGRRACAGAPDTPGLSRADDLNGDGLPDAARHVSHAVDLANQIAGVATDPDGSGPVAADELEFIYDPAGNLIFDGRLVYFYDGFNRLVQVNLACTAATTPACLEAPDFDIHGKLAGTPQPQPAALVARFAYDGLGRLIRRETPLAVGAPTAFEPYVQTAEFYYDGVRRIQEVLRRAGSAVEALVTAQWLPVEALAWPQLEEREFVYGPEYVDEFVAVYDSTFEAGGPGSGEFDLPVFVLQDANYNVVALLSPDADPGDGVAVAPDGLVLAQFVWEPYGALAAVDRAQIAPGVCVGPVYTFGHQGLFFERFATEPGAHAGSTTLTPGAIGLYYNRNRWYSPELGRFLTRDPNETAMPIIAAVASRGETSGPLNLAFDILQQYGDGANLYAFVRSNPNNLRDPLGAWTYVELGATAGIQGLLGGLISGAISSATGGSFGHGFSGGLIGGALGGATGFLANSAFAASTSGLWATFAANSLVGAADGAVSAFGQSFYSTGDLKAALADAFFGIVIGGATGGLMDTPAIRNLFVPQKARDILAKLQARNWTPPQGYKGGRVFKNHEGSCPLAETIVSSISTQIRPVCLGTQSELLSM